MVRRQVDLDALAILGEHRTALLREVAEVETKMRPDIVRAVRSGDASQRGIHRLTGVSRVTVKAWIDNAGPEVMVKATLKRNR